MPDRNQLRIVLSTLFPGHARNEVLLAKQLTKDASKVLDLVVVNGNQDDAVVSQQASREFDSRVDHVEPVSVEPPTGLRVAASCLAFSINLIRQFLVVTDVVSKVVRIDEVFPSVVRRVDVDQLNLACIALLQQLEHFKVIPLDHQVFGRVPIDTFIRARPQRARAGRQCQLTRPALAMPVQAVFLFRIGGGLVTHQRLEHIHIHSHTIGALSDQLREQGLELFDVGRHQVGRLGLGAVGFQFLHWFQLCVVRVHSDVFKVVHVPMPVQR
ncbi:MAG: hypothetical protein DDT34_02388 [Firmicutes bacterium]|nr:hypothetical protein [Bacillota bacterium]